MGRVQKAVAFFVALISVIAMILMVIGGGILTAFGALFGLIGVDLGNSFDFYPLGAGVIVVYGCGILLAVDALRRPLVAGIAMLPLGACAFLFGGPIAKVYGIAIVCSAVVLLAISSRHSKA